MDFERYINIIHFLIKEIMFIDFWIQMNIPLHLISFTEKGQKINMYLSLVLV